MFDPVRILKDLIRFDTSNPPGNEMPALAYVQSLLAAWNVETFLQESAPNRGNLLARIPGPPGSGKPPLLLLSHIDVVGAKPEEWSHPPFAAEEEDGFIYGRGTVDTKQLTVMELAALHGLVQGGATPDRDVYLLASCDEESGSALGLQYFLDHPVAIGGRSRLGRELLANCDCISEGGGFPILVNGKQFYLCESGQKSVGTLCFTLPARHGQGPFLPSGDGMLRAMELVQAIGALQLEEKLLPSARRFSDSLKEAAGGVPNWRASLPPALQNILRAIGRNTITVTLVEGTNLNEVTVTCDVRLVPGFDRNYLETVTAPLCEQFDSTCELLHLGEGYESNPAGEWPAALEAATLAALGDKAGDSQLLPFLSMGSSDGRYLAPIGARVYGYSPVLAKDMTFDTAVGMVHGVNERIHRDSLLFGCRVLAEAVLGVVAKCRP